MHFRIKVLLRQREVTEGVIRVVDLLMGKAGLRVARLAIEVND